ncbi:MAG: MFS transporter [Candidatus Caldatribacteriaceae bacterium]
MSTLMFFFHFVVDFVVSFPAPLGPHFIHFYGLPTRNITMGIALLALTGSLSQLFFALITKSSYSPWKRMYQATVLTVIPLFLFGISIPFGALLISFLVIGLAEGYFHPQGAAVAGENRGGHGVTWFISGGILGGALGPVFITWFVSQWTLSGIVWIAISLLILINIWFLLIPKPEFQSRKISFSWHFFGTLWPIWFMVSSRTFFSAVFHTFVPIYVASKGYSLLSGGSMLSAGIFLGIVANILGNRMRSFLRNGRLNLLSFLILGTSILSFMEMKSLPLMFFFYILADFATFLTMSTNVAEAQELLPENKVLASSISMGFSWAFGHTLSLLWASLFGNNPVVALKSVGSISLGVALFIFLFERLIISKSVQVQSE